MLLRFLLVAFALASYANAFADDISLQVDLSKTSVGFSARPLFEVHKQIEGLPLDQRPKPLPTRRGVLLGRVNPRGPAAKAGLHDGTIITSIGDVAVNSQDDCKDAIASTDIGQEVDIEGFAPPEQPDSGWTKQTWKIRPTTYRELLLASFIEHKDDSLGLTSMRHWSSPAPGTDEDAFFATIMRDDRRVFLRMRMVWTQYAFANQFPVTGFKVKTDLRDIEFPDLKRDRLQVEHTGIDENNFRIGTVSYDHDTTESHRQALLGVADSQDAKLCLIVGKNQERIERRSITAMQKVALKTTLEAYCVLRDELAAKAK